MNSPEVMFSDALDCHRYAEDHPEYREWADWMASMLYSLGVSKYVMNVRTLREQYPGVDKWAPEHLRHCAMTTR